jgi:endonuclease/exonuclease/phosphatase family metal-dependent hydrolase
MTDPAKPPLRLASYNVRAGLGTDLRRDAHRVLDTLAGLDADIVALQEADFRTGRRPTALPPEAIQARTGLVPVPVGRGDSLGWHGNAILTRPGIPVGEVLRLDLPGLEPRGALIADLGGPLPLRVVAVHLGLLRGSRRAQIDRLRHVLDDLPPLPTVILGDFNEWSRKTGLGRLARDYAIVTPGPTFPSSRPVASLDRLAHCPRIKVATVPLPRRRGPHASDHLPVLATLSPA